MPNMSYVSALLLIALVIVQGTQVPATLLENEKSVRIHRCAAEICGSQQQTPLI